MVRLAYLFYMRGKGIMDFINNILTQINDVMYTYVLIILLIVAGLYFTIRTRGAQFRLFGDGIKSMLDKADNKEGEKAVSSFQALMISTASRVGTGNIAGIATAIATGGPGAVFWMWLMAIIGGASAFIESTLAQIYKVKQEDGQYRGGPSYYMERALGKRWMGILFSILLIPNNRMIHFTHMNSNLILSTSLNPNI